MTLHVQVITPEKVIYEAEADEIVIPTITGEITVLPQHVPVLTQLGPGELTIKVHGKSEHLVVVGGFVEITPKEVTILADYAAHGKDISESQAKEAKERAEKMMKESTSQKDFAIAEGELRKALLELRIAGKVKNIH